METGDVQIVVGNMDTGVVGRVLIGIFVYAILGRVFTKKNTQVIFPNTIILINKSYLA